MLDIKGKIIEKLPYKNLKLFKILLNFEYEPLLCHYIDDDKNNILFYWVDFDSEYNRWLVTEVNDDILLSYLKGQISLFVLFESGIKNYFVDIENDDMCKIYDDIEIPDKYLPKANSYYRLNVNDNYTQIFNI